MAEATAATMGWTMPRGVAFSHLTGKEFVQDDVILGIRRFSGVQEVHTGGGPLQSPTMPEKPNLPQVGSGVFWSNGCDGHGVHRPVGYLF